jgi:hypothetical protein
VNLFECFAIVGDPNLPSFSCLQSLTADARLCEAYVTLALCIFVGPENMDGSRLAKVMQVVSILYILKYHANSASFTFGVNALTNENLELGM